MVAQARVDAEDAHIVEGYKWKLDKRRNCVYTQIHRQRTYMHRLVLLGLTQTKQSQKVVVVHINKDKLDNRKKNLLQTNASMRSHLSITGRTHNHSRYKGVKWIVKQ